MNGGEGVPMVSIGSVDGAALHGEASVPHAAVTCYDDAAMATGAASARISEDGVGIIVEGRDGDRYVGAAMEMDASDAVDLALALLEAAAHYETARGRDPRRTVDPSRLAEKTTGLLGDVRESWNDPVEEDGEADLAL